MLSRRKFLKGLIGTGFVLTSSGLILGAAADASKQDALFRICVDRKHGFIDKTGKVIVPPQYEDALGFYEGLGHVKIGDRWGYIDTSGNFAIKPQFINYGVFSEGLAAAMIETNKWGYINKNGQWVIKPQFDSACDFSEGFACVLLNNKWIFINRSGEIAINKEFQHCSWFSEGLAAIDIGGKYGYIDKSGLLVIPPLYRTAHNFKEGLASVGHSERPNTFIDRNRRVVINSRRFQYTSSFSGGLAAVKINGKWGFINKTGQIVIEPEFFEMGLSYFKLEAFSSGLAPVKDENKYGFINVNGNFVIEPQYDAAWCFRNGLAKVLKYDDKDDLAMGYIDRSGKYIWEPTA